MGLSRGPRLVAFSIVLGLALVAASVSGQESTEVVVTSAADGPGECPHASDCTLRAAIGLANADASEAAYVIRFDPGVFDQAAPATIALLEPLPAVTHADATIDASGAGVVIDGANLEGQHDGLVMSGARGVVRGLSVHDFDGRCIALAAPGARAIANHVGRCGTGIAADGPGSAVVGNVVGFEAGTNAPATVAVGIAVDAADVDVGDPAGGPGTANTIGNSGTAILVGGTAGAAFEGVRVARNIIGRTPEGSGAAPVTTGIAIRPPAGHVSVTDNLLANVTGSGVVVGGDDGEASRGNEILGNRFEQIGGLAIDLGADGVREANDNGDADGGANDLLNYPVITRAVQSRIEGRACAGCTVQVYLAAHHPGADGDEGGTPVQGGTLTADSSGGFAFNAPPLTPGQWVTAIAVDDEGNTSEFAPGVRLGAGILQCGNIALSPGWNLTGYFGQGAFALGNSFPLDGDPESEVSAIYRLSDGSINYQSWFANGGSGRTLDTLDVGEAYWMHASQAVAVEGGFSLTIPLPVPLKAGWNEFVYIGASADIRDALSSIAGKYTAVYRWSNTGHEARWLTYQPALPRWAQGFREVQACAAYSIFVTQDVTLTPLQP